MPPVQSSELCCLFSFIWLLATPLHCTLHIDPESDCFLPLCCSLPGLTHCHLSLGPQYYPPYRSLGLLPTEEQALLSFFKIYVRSGQLSTQNPQIAQMSLPQPQSIHMAPVTPQAPCPNFTFPAHSVPSSWTCHVPRTLPPLYQLCPQPGRYCPHRSIQLSLVSLNVTLALPSPLLQSSTSMTLHSLVLPCSSTWQHPPTLSVHLLVKPHLSY